MTKLTDALSTVGGLYSFIVGFFGLLLLSYNSYVYELDVASNTFKKEKGARTNFKFTGIWRYTKYSIYEFLKFLGCNPDWKDCRNIYKRRKETNALI